MNILIFSIFLLCYNAYANKVVEVITVSKSNLVKTVNLMGIVKSFSSTTFKSKVNGSLLQIKKAGENVKKNEIIAEIVNNELKETLILLKEFESVALKQYNRVKDLKTFSSKEIEDAKLNLINAKLKRLESENRLKDSQLIADFDGVVGTYKVPNFESISIGFEIVDFYDNSEYVVELYIPVSILSKIKDGTNAKIFNKTIKIPKIPFIVDTKTHMALVKIPIEHSGFIGEVVDIEVEVEKIIDAIIIPSEAIFLKNGNSCVYVIKDNKTELTFVEKGIESENLVEIKDGLNVLDKVVAKSPTRLFPDEEIQIFNSDLL